MQSEVFSICSRGCSEPILDGSAAGWESESEGSWQKLHVGSFSLLLPCLRLTHTRTRQALQNWVFLVMSRSRLTSSTSPWKDRDKKEAETSTEGSPCHHPEKSPNDPRSAFLALGACNTWQTSKFFFSHLIFFFLFCALQQQRRGLAAEGNDETWKTRGLVTG